MFQWYLAEKEFYHESSEWEFLKASEAVSRRCSVKKVLLEILQNSLENTYARVSFLIKLQAWKKALAQVFSYEFCEISKNTFYYKTSLVLAFEESRNKWT